METTLTIQQLQTPEEAHLCAMLMAGSEPWITLRRSYDHCLRTLKDPIRESYVAFEEKAFAGFVILNLRGPFPGYIQTIGVVSDRRRRGIGAKLISFSEARIFQNFPNVFLCVSSFNTDAQRFYARLGYERIGELRDYVVKGHSEFLMRKTLGPIVDFRPPA